MQQRLVTIQINDNQNGDHLERELKNGWRVVSVTPASCPGYPGIWLHKGEGRHEAYADPVEPFAIFAVVLEQGKGSS